MRKRRDGLRLNQTTDANGSPFGVGVQVHVVESEGAADAFVGEPTGVIVSLGSALPYAGITRNARTGRVWVVAFDEPAYLADGRGPFERAEISEAFLEAAPELG
ncbi:hypothetical protein GCM10027416_31790 [Okibacterium endophyticum]